MNLRFSMSSQPLAQGEAFPKFWKTLLVIVGVGKTAVGGAGAALALAGCLNIAAAVTAQHWLRDFEKHYLDYFAVGGGVIGAAFATAARTILR